MKRNKIRVLFQGDSITDAGRREDSGAFHQMGQGYAYLAAALLGYQFPEKNFEFINRGVGGNTCAQLCGRWQEEALDLEPDVISILVGTNDAGRESRSRHDLAYHGMEPALDLLLRQTREILPETEIILMEPFLVDCGNFDRSVFKRRMELLKDYQQIIRRYAEKYHAVFIPLQERFTEALKKQPADYWFIDSVHPTCAGHGLIADAWLTGTINLFIDRK